MPAFDTSLSPETPQSAVHHSPARQWQCAECQTAFSRSRLLEEHARSSKHKTYKCDVTGCSSSFIGRTALSRHLTTHTDKKRHTCSKCGKSFARADHTREHEGRCVILSARLSQEVPRCSQKMQNSGNSEALAKPAPRKYIADAYSAAASGANDLDHNSDIAPLRPDQAAEAAANEVDAPVTINTVHSTPKRPLSRLSTFSTSHDEAIKRICIEPKCCDSKSAESGKNVKVHDDVTSVFNPTTRIVSQNVPEAEKQSYGALLMSPSHELHGVSRSGDEEVRCEDKEVHATYLQNCNVTHDGGTRTLVSESLTAGAISSTKDDPSAVPRVWETETTTTGSSVWFDNDDDCDTDSVIMDEIPTIWSELQAKSHAATVKTSVDEQVQSLPSGIDFAGILKAPQPGELCSLCSVVQPKLRKPFLDHILGHLTQQTQLLTCERCDVKFLFHADLKNHSSLECYRSPSPVDASRWVEDSFKTDFILKLRAWEKVRTYWYFRAVKEMVLAQENHDIRSLRSLPTRLSETSQMHDRGSLDSMQSCLTNLGRQMSIDTDHLIDQLAALSVEPTAPRQVVTSNLPRPTREVRLAVFGKDSQCARLIQRFNNDYRHELNPDLENAYRKKVGLNGRYIMLELINISGTGQFQALMKMQYRLSQGLLICFDVDSVASVSAALDQYESVLFWLNDRTAREERALLIKFVAIRGEKGWHELAKSKWDGAVSRSRREFAPVNVEMLVEVDLTDLRSIEKPFHALAQDVLNSPHELIVLDKVRPRSQRGLRRLETKFKGWRTALSGIEETAA